MQNSWLKICRSIFQFQLENGIFVIVPDHQTIHVLRCVVHGGIPSTRLLGALLVRPSPSKMRRQGFVQARGWARTGMHKRGGRAAIKEKRKVSRASASSKFLQVVEKTWSSFSSQYQESVRYLCCSYLGHSSYRLTPPPLAIIFLEFPESKSGKFY